jgi:hypothetical protein
MGGDTAKAKTNYQNFLTLWKNSDPDVPVLNDAKSGVCEVAVGLPALELRLLIFIFFAVFHG